MAVHRARARALALGLDDAPRAGAAPLVSRAAVHERGRRAGAQACRGQDGKLDTRRGEIVTRAWRRAGATACRRAWCSSRSSTRPPRQQAHARRDLPDLQGDRLQESARSRVSRATASDAASREAEDASGACRTGRSSAGSSSPDGGGRAGGGVRHRPGGARRAGERFPPLRCVRPARWPRRISWRVRALRPVRACVPVRHAEALARSAAGPPARPTSRRARSRARCARTCRASRRARAARWTRRSPDRQGANGPGGDRRPGDLPQLPRPALRRLLPRLPGSSTRRSRSSRGTTSAPASTRSSSRRCIRTSAPAAASASGRACSRRPRSRCCREAGQGARSATTTGSAGRKRRRPAGRSFPSRMQLPVRRPDGQ